MTRERYERCVYDLMVQIFDVPGELAISVIEENSLTVSSNHTNGIPFVQTAATICGYPQFEGAYGSRFGNNNNPTK